MISVSRLKLSEDIALASSPESTPFTITKTISNILHHLLCGDDIVQNSGVALSRRQAVGEPLEHVFPGTATWIANGAVYLKNNIIIYFPTSKVVEESTSI